MDSKIILSFVFYFVVILLTSCGINKNENIGKEIVLRLEPKNGNPRNSEGDFINLKDGRILFIYTHFTAGTGDNAGAHLAGRYSADEGKTWSVDDETFLGNEGGMNVMSVSLFRLSDDRIALFYLRKNSESDCIPYMRTSNDEAKSWSEATRCIPDSGYFVVNNDRVVRLKSGRIIFPTSLHKTDKTETTNIGKIRCYYSDDEGQTWQKGKDALNPDQAITQEPGIIELKDGKLMLFCRTQSGAQYISYSSNLGENWSTLKPSNIKSPLSPASIERIPLTGDLLLIWNNNYEAVRDGGKRTPYNLAISKDDGISWEKIKTIESNPNGWYCYTAIEFVGDNILLGHCAGDRSKNVGLATTHITKLSMDWVYRNATSQPFIKSNNNGIIELACKDKNAIIYYSTDRSFPTIETSQIYNKPFVVNGTTHLQMFATSDGSTVSNLVSTFIGEDIYQSTIDSLIILGTGLEYKYFEGHFKNTSEIEKSVINKSGIVSKFSITDKNTDTNFAFIFNGIIKIKKDGLYTFYLESNDGSVLYLDDKKVIDNDGLHGAYEEDISISLREGLHKISVKYFQAGGGKVLKNSWSNKNFKKIEIPASILFH
ncbi:MAG: exo-alpha-sialidase [Melioribacteraceae bacterium]